jgi:[ribosomal protein S18]-alanine N-acetyltransferase
MNHPQILLMTPEDIDEVHAIEARVYTQPWTVNLFRGELMMPDKRVYLAARVEGELAGYAGLMLVDGEAHVTTLAVDAPWQRQSIGSLLVLRLIELAIMKRVHWLTLEVRESNEAARALYSKFGFKKIGVRPKYYADGEDAVIMWTNDIQSDEYREMIARMKAELEKC